ncbi:hypothetical protein IAR55_002789 [Kwoniella newhampshirensis]|uniref:Uncharacterized protein n=1 Tax=Kwoniella newhampshirensis TaxID=1651941 RepID=A0AAW0YXP5_9TREE
MSSQHRRIRSSLSSLDDVWDPLPSSSSRRVSTSTNTNEAQEKVNRNRRSSGGEKGKTMSGDVYGISHDEMRRERRPNETMKKKGFLSRIFSCTCFEFELTDWLPPTYPSDSDPVRKYRSKYEARYGQQPSDQPTDTIPSSGPGTMTGVH